MIRHGLRSQGKWLRCVQMRNSFKMVKKPFFSIVIPTYNRASDLHFALFCILRQSFSDFEVIISDNCSTDKTKIIVHKLKDKRIKYFRNKKNITYAINARNAMEHVTGDYVFLHSDDDFLLDKNSLLKVYKKIKKYNPGYVRAIYICISPDRKRIFNFRVNNPFTKNEYLPPFSESKRVLSYIVNSDHYFITGTVFKNSFPSNIKLISSEHAPWMEILFYVTKNFGAYFIAEPYVAASWSTWRNKKNGSHPVYSLINGRLESENYFSVVRKKIDRQEYNVFLHNQLMGIYVRLFPIIKILVGNRDLLQFSARIRLLDPTMKKSIAYWSYLIGALVLQKWFLKMVKEVFLYLYIRLSKVDNEKQIVNKLKDLEREYFHDWGNMIKDKGAMFKF